jgi:hypothetical protein
MLAVSGILSAKTRPAFSISNLIFNVLFEL